MPLDRRDFLTVSGLATLGALAACKEPQETRSPSPAEPSSEPPQTESAVEALDGLSGGDEWDDVRRLFSIEPGLIDLGTSAVTAHPRPVAEAIAGHRDALDSRPTAYLATERDRLDQAARSAVARYLGLSADAVTLTGSATFAAGLLFDSLPLVAGDEILTTNREDFVIHEAARLAATRTGASLQAVDLPDDPSELPDPLLVSRLVSAVTPRTRVLALGWVHPDTGLRLPVRAISDAIAELNAQRDDRERILVCLDATHGLGVIGTSFEALGCDYVFAACDRWLFGPRGTGFIAGRTFERLRPPFPSDLDPAMRNAWRAGQAPSGPVTAARLTPGGTTAFEHVWALPAAFALHAERGPDLIAERTLALAAQLKDGLQAMEHTRLWSPLEAERGSGIVAFDINAFSPANVVGRLREENIMALVSASRRPRVVLAPSIRNTPAEIDTVLAAIRALRD
ncbi:aminotransferase class V-fold PLP-dependent enzyme [Maricaulis sp. CAU 1757]